MSLFCGVCNQQCVAATDVKCGGCDRVFHSSCIKEDLELKKTRSNWKCKDCRASSKTSSSGTVASTSLTKELLVRVVEDFKREVFEELKTFRKEMTEMTTSLQEDFKQEVFEELKIFRKDMTEVTTSLQFMSDKIDTSNSLMEEVKIELASIKKENEELRNKNLKLDNEVGALKEKVRTLEQYTRLNNLEINDIPVTPGENAISIIKDIGRALNVDLHEDQIEAAHRVQSYNKKRIPPLIVRFQSRTTRDILLDKYRQKRTLDAKEVNKAFTSKRIYINEHLSPDNKQFLAALKQKCRDSGYAYTWCRDGKFFVKKAQGEITKKIYSLNDINSIK